MSDTTNESAVESQEQVQNDGNVQPDSNESNEQSNTVNEKKDNKELINSLKEEIKGELTATWQEQEKVYKNQVKGLDRRISELTQENKSFKQKEMSEEEKLADERKEIANQRQSLWRDLSVVQDFHFMEEEDRNIVKSYLYGNTHEDMAGSAKALFNVFDKYKNDAIEKSKQELLAQGYKPQSAGVAGQKSNELSDMTSEELGAYVKKVASMPDGEEKTSLLKLLMIEEHSRRSKRR